MPVVIPSKTNDHWLVGYFDVSRRTIERWLDSWSEIGVDSLAIQPGRGVKTRLKGLDTVIAEQLKDHSRNLKNVLTYLKEQHNIVICKKTLQNFLKDTGLYLEKSQTIPKKQVQPEWFWTYEEAL